MPTSDSDYLCLLSWSPPLTPIICVYSLDAHLWLWLFVFTLLVPYLWLWLFVFTLVMPTSNSDYLCLLSWCQHLTLNIYVYSLDTQLWLWIFVLTLLIPTSCVYSLDAHLWLSLFVFTLLMPTSDSDYLFLLSGCPPLNLIICVYSLAHLWLSDGDDGEGLLVLLDGSAAHLGHNRLLLLPI